MWLWENRKIFILEFILKIFFFIIVKNKVFNKIFYFEIKCKVYQEIVEKYEMEFFLFDFYLENELFRLYEEVLRKLLVEFCQVYEMN